jgi:hypothetical protein
MQRPPTVGAPACKAAAAHMGKAAHARWLDPRQLVAGCQVEHVFRILLNPFYYVNNVAVLENAACKAGKAGETPPSCLPHCATPGWQCCLAQLRHACTAGSTHCNTLLTVHDEHVDHSCQNPGASGAPTLLRPGSIKQWAAH